MKEIITVRRALTSNLSQELHIFEIFSSQRLETTRNRKRTIRVSWSSPFVVLTFQIALIFYYRKTQWEGDWLLSLETYKAWLWKNHLGTLGLYCLRGKIEGFNVQWLKSFFCSRILSLFIILVSGVPVQEHKEGRGSSFKLGLVRQAELPQRLHIHGPEMERRWQNNDWSRNF